MIKIEIFTDEYNIHQCRIYVNNILDRGFKRENLLDFKKKLNEVIDEMYNPTLKVINRYTVEYCTCPVCGQNYPVSQIQVSGKCDNCLTKLEV
ncbi:MAG: hypothetical protein SOY04_00140 [Clostridium celatum]|nr:hypothetical protein [Clostridium celatum]